MKKKIASLLLVVRLVFAVAQKSIPLTLRLNEVYKDTSVNVEVPSRPSHPIG